MAVPLTTVASFCFDESMCGCSFSYSWSTYSAGYSLNKPSSQTGLVEDTCSGLKLAPAGWHLVSSHPAFRPGPVTMQPSNSTTMQSYNHAILQPCNPTTMQPSSPTTIQSYNNGTMHPSNPITMQSYNHATMHPAVKQQCNHAHSSQATLQPRTQQSSNPCKH